MASSGAKSELQFRRGLRWRSPSGRFKSVLLVMLGSGSRVDAVDWGPISSQIEYFALLEQVEYVDRGLEAVGLEVGNSAVNTQDLHFLFM